MSVTINKFDPSIAIVPIPKYATNIRIVNGGYLEFTDSTGHPHVIPIAPGDWHLLFKGSEAREEDAMKVVEKHPEHPFFKDYPPSDPKIEEWWTEAIDSLQSLLRANGIHLTPQQDVIFIKNNNQ